jgi:hypothetical protein
MSKLEKNANNALIDSATLVNRKIKISATIVSQIMSSTTIDASPIVQQLHLTMLESARIVYRDVTTASTAQPAKDVTQQWFLT